MKKLALLLGLVSVLSAMVGRSVWADDCSLSVAAGDTLAYNLTTMSAPASCESVTVTLIHTGKMAANVMGHNWVLAKDADVNGVAMDGLTAGAGAGYLKADDSRILAATGLIGGGETSSVTFSTAGMAASAMTFFCTFPGHSYVMKGKFSID